MCDINVHDNSASYLNESYSTYGLKQLAKDQARITFSTSSLIDHIATNHLMNIAVACRHKICLSEIYGIFSMEISSKSSKRSKIFHIKAHDTFQ